jgi:hypothetical protein
VVVAHLDLGSKPEAYHTFPSIVRLFVGRLLGLHGLTADIFYRVPVPAWRIAAIWQPRDPLFDRFDRLPRE